MKGSLLAIIIFLALVSMAMYALTQRYYERRVMENIVNNSIISKMIKNKEYHIEVDPFKREAVIRVENTSILVRFDEKWKIREVIPEATTSFCGVSTYGPCKSDGDCMVSGCSSQVCQSKLESPIVTTCEWRECYDARRYGYKCKCIDGKCMWTK